MTWGWGLAAGAAATMVRAELLWLIVWLVTLRPPTEGGPFSAPLELFSIIALAGISTMGSIAGFVAVPDPWHNRLICFGLACFAGAEFASKIGSAPLMH